MSEQTNSPERSERIELATMIDDMANIRAIDPVVRERKQEARAMRRQAAILYHRLTTITEESLIDVRTKVGKRWKVKKHAGRKIIERDMSTRPAEERQLAKVLFATMLRAEAIEKGEKDADNPTALHDIARQIRPKANGQEIQQMQMGAAPVTAAQDGAATTAVAASANIEEPTRPMSLREIGAAIGYGWREVADLLPDALTKAGIRYIVDLAKAGSFRKPIKKYLADNPQRPRRKPRSATRSAT